MKYIDALYYNDMFYYAACWDTTAAFYRELKNMNRNSYKLLALKDNIRTRVIGLGWEDLIMHWSNNFKSFTPEDIALHLKVILSNQWSRSIQTNPPLFIPAKKALPQLGTQVPNVLPWMQLVLKPVINLSIRKDVQYCRGRQLASATDIPSCSLLQR